MLKLYETTSLRAKQSILSLRGGNGLLRFSRNDADAVERLSLNSHSENTAQIFCPSGYYVAPQFHYFCFSAIQITPICSPSRPTKGAFRDRHKRGTGCDGRWQALLTRAFSCGRPRRVVPAPRRWCQVRAKARGRWWPKSPAHQLSHSHISKRAVQRAGKCESFQRDGCPPRPAFSTSRVI